MAEDRFNDFNKETSLYNDDDVTRDSFDEEYARDESVDYNEETAAESAVNTRMFTRDTDDATDTAGTGIGWLAIVLSVIALFFLPVVMGAAGIIVGIIARKQGARALGAWAIGIGIAAIVIMMFAAPFF
ncbi:hypothetical protein EV207_101347 [Scopulibacillus darangshiensis]|uniref:DUF4190 domain-containing protein n=1 Tax=Scopulibacillus darangshiensis TaxID=442528 RepID=A0A4R2PD36_9BACL|nr:DUF4190 domain-containing protein [Scopulibacillus darangshiensis]TCP32368.1 hypothetical protein EV207_101347 [Scopulibacillus darangshiensis]